MKQLLAYLIDYQKKHFDWKLYGTILLFLAVCIKVNYALDFEDSIIDSYQGEPIKWVWMFLFQGGPFLVVCLILYAFGKSRSWLTSKNFWLKFFVGFGLLALDRSFYGFNFLIHSLHRLEYPFIMRCIGWASSLILVVIPLLLLYQFLEKDEVKNWYGLAWKKFSPTPYLILLGIAAAFLAIGSFTAEIQNYYPIFNRSGANTFLRHHDVPRWWLATIFELSYGSNFISVELIFRGFLIFAFSRTLGSWAVLPMIASYAFLHFGKPVGESVSSIFGGYILGIISYNSRNIWGGIFIHLGVAWLMELFGWLQSLR
ncbi:MAG: CPBP family intramembrane glutamic endopeptidase [Cyclobacteriaceae bacterium]